ncbi:MAG TPA: hypothetical protein VGG42_14415 [Acidobacteriaceae bacterium]|jgi:hypothetical protein
MKLTPRFRGPSLVFVATAYVLVTAAGLVAGALLRHGASWVTPFAPAEQLRAFFAQSPMAARVSNFFLFGSAVPFGIFAVTLISRLRFMGVRAAGTNIALFGGLSAAIALFLSGAAGWILSIPEVVDSAPLVKAVAFFNFLCGGVFYAVGFGLLAAGVSVTAYFMRFLPRWIVVLGMILAVTGEASSLSLIAYPANFFIPITRFAGFLWMLLVAIALTKRGAAKPMLSTETAAS